MHRRPDESRITEMAQAAISGGWIREVDTAAVFIDLPFLAERYRSLVKAFPPGTLHAAAVKANPLVKVLSFLRVLGAGAEAASIPELHIARESGIGTDRIVYDSPCKTREELRTALHAGVHINADSLMELERMAEILAGDMPKGNIGLRVNPQVGSGAIEMTSTAGTYSKFGVPLKTHEAEICEAFRRFRWLNTLHIHIGSQGMQLEQIAHAASRLTQLAEKINADPQSRDQIQYLDIGGGLSAAYRDTDAVITAQEYRETLEKAAPEIFSGKYKLITEIGRWLFAHAGIALARVEYVKEYGDWRTAMIHAGADLFLRECYQPQHWHHDFLALTPEGKLKEGELHSYVLAGPLCFSGDVLSKNAMLPALEPGDFIAVRDAGAYTFSMWSMYNSREFPRILGCSGGRCELLRERSSAQDMVEFWS